MMKEVWITYHRPFTALLSRPILNEICSSNRALSSFFIHVVPQMFTNVKRNVLVPDQRKASTEELMMRVPRSSWWKNEKGSTLSDGEEVTNHEIFQDHQEGNIITGSRPQCTTSRFFSKLSVFVVFQ